MNINISDEMHGVYLYYIHSSLKYCTCYYNIGSYGSSFQSLFEDFYFIELLERKWGKALLSHETLNLLNEFYLEWKNYILENPFGSDFFVFFDKDYRMLIREFLIPALDSMERDLVDQNLDRIEVEGNVLKLESYKEIYKPDNRPSDDEIIWKVNHLYSLLEDYQIIKKPYMGDS